MDAIRKKRNAHASLACATTLARGSTANLGIMMMDPANARRSVPTDVMKLVHVYVPFSVTTDVT